MNTPIAPVNNCLVLGAGRSGTSVTGLLLARAGYHVYSSTYVPDEANPLGYFEDVDVNSGNDAILAPFYRSVWGRFSRMLQGKPQLPLPQAWLLDLCPRQIDTLTLHSTHAAKFKELFARTPFAYKDPRFSFTLGALAPLIPKDTRYLCVFRDPRQVVESTQKHARRCGLDVDDKYCFAVWEAHYRCLLEHYRRLGDQWMFVSHEQLIGGAGVLRIEEFLNIQLDRRLIRAELSRARGSSTLPEGVTRLFKQLMDLSGLER